MSSRVLQADRYTEVTLTETPEGPVVRKSYRTPGHRVWQTFLRRSRGRREFRNLARLAAAGIPVVDPVECGESRAFGCSLVSHVTTAFRSGSHTLSTEFADGPIDRHRRYVMRAFGELVRSVHRAGFLSTSFYPRNVLIHGSAPDRELLLCDQPDLVRWPRSVHGTRLADVDLYDVAFTPHRKWEISAVERYRILLAYTDGDRAAVRRIWRRLWHRRRFVHRMSKETVRGVGRILGGLRRA